MHLSELLTRLETAGFPVAFLNFQDEEKQDLPYITYLIVKNTEFFADGVVYFSSKLIEMKIYAKKKDISLEIDLTQALRGEAYRLSEELDKKNDRYIYTVTLEVI